MGLKESKNDVRLTIAKLETALTLIRDMPFSMVNDSESLRCTLRQMQNIARVGLERNG
jgi:hypothetical protein